LTRFSKLDPLLLLMTLIWGTNYTVIKSAFREVDPQGFNAVRLILASLVMLATMAITRRVRWNPADVFHTAEPVTRRDWIALAGLGFVGHGVYQYLFIGGVARTSIANSSLLLAASPVVITILGVALSRVGGFGERVTAMHWAGTLLSLAGIYIVVRSGGKTAGQSLVGDLMMGGAVLCWSFYTIAARPLMERHSPVGVTALSMAIGTLFYVPLAWPVMMRVPWTTISVPTWLALIYSAVLSICVAYVIWYVGVRELGSARTAVYSNLMPIVAMVTAAVWLREPVSRGKVIGAALVLAGVALTRVRTGTLTLLPKAGHFAGRNCDSHRSEPKL
jgi:drug/metabolite transporter (DMT)-like permease